eukprot:5690481-Karenia_brevis.AAC.1
MKISKLTALLKDNGRVRGIAAGDTSRRLVSKTIARQSQATLRSKVSPDNFGMCNRSGTDSLAHMINFLTDEDPSKVVVSIDG